MTNPFRNEKLPTMKKQILIIACLLAAVFTVRAQGVIRIGIIGLDTSHSTAFTELLNGTSDDPLVREFEVVAAYPYGSTAIRSSRDRIPGYIETVKKFGVEITASVAELLDKVDCVLLETNDGRLHLGQAVEVFRSGKICYIDKPLGATLGEAIAIYEMAERYGASVFTSSALRYSPQNAALRRGDFGKILGADCYSPHTVEPTHPDFGFYGIHGVETLYTLLGTGCEAVSRIHSPMGDIVSGRTSRHVPRRRQGPGRLWRYGLYGEGDRCRGRIRRLQGAARRDSPLFQKRCEPRIEGGDPRDLHFHEGFEHEPRTRRTYRYDG